MFTHIKAHENKVDLYLWNIDKSSDELLEIIPNLYSKRYKDYISTFKSEKRKIEWLASRFIIHTVLGKDIDICYTKSGKPFIKDKDIFLSISHTKGIVAVAFSKHFNIGIDIESSNGKLERISNRFVREDERELANNIYDQDKLLLLWTIKESIYKCMTTPDANLLNIKVNDIQSKEKLILSSGKIIHNKEKYIVETFFSEDYTISISIIN